MIVAADDMRDLHQRVINHNYVVVHGHPIRAQDDRITHNFVGEFHVPMHEVVKTDGMLRNPQPDGARFTCYPALLRLRRINGAAFAGIDRLAMLGLCPFTLFLQVWLGAETQVRFPLI